jgi:hypothetical protein
LDYSTALGNHPVKAAYLLAFNGSIATGKTWFQNSKAE